MTTAAPRQSTRSRPAMPAICAVSGAGLSVALTGYATFKEDNLPGDTADWLFINLPIIAVATAVVFGLVVRRTLRHTDAEPIARTSLVLALLAVTAIVVFYLGLTAVLAAGAVCTALAARDRSERWTAVPGVAVALSAVAIGLAVIMAIIG